jgi:hypothetical protein
MRPAHQEILYARDHLFGRIVDFDDLDLGHQAGGAGSRSALSAGFTCEAPVQVAAIAATPILSGLHHQYARI